MFLNKINNIIIKKLIFFYKNNIFIKQKYYIKT